MTKPPLPTDDALQSEIDLRTLEEALSQDATGEVLVKSAERVRDLGEVFTPAATVEAMLDLLPEDVWQPHPTRTFLEPACGNGNFLVAILQRKLDSIAAQWKEKTLPAGNSVEAVLFHALQALSSIYGVDIAPENVIGDSSTGELGARRRLLNVLHAWLDPRIRSRSGELSQFWRSAEWIVERNILVGNMLPFSEDGSPSGRENLPIIEYLWEPRSLAVTVLQLTLGDVMDQAAAETSGTLRLFSNEPEPLWSGAALDLYEAQAPPPSVPKKRVANE